MKRYISDNPRILCKYVDQSSNESLINLFDECGSFDIIIDDGSHILSHQKRTLDIGFNYLNSNGLFIMEDLHTSFDKYKNSHHDSYPTTYQVVQEMSKTYKIEFFEAPTVGWDDISRTCIIFKNEN